MSGKAEKKIRRLARRKFQGDVRNMQAEIERLVKLPPKYFPVRLWFWLQGLFLNI